MRKCSNAFFSETTNIIKAKLYMNVHWMVLYKLYEYRTKETHIANITLRICNQVVVIIRRQVNSIFESDNVS